MILDLGLTQYEETHRKQLEYVTSVTLKNASEVILITEHFPIYTCGKSTKSWERPQELPIRIIDIERGGKVTYHGPGQLVGYPILNLGARKWSIPQYLHLLEEAIIASLNEIGLKSYRGDPLAGVWADGKKIASIGIAIRKWVSFHGFSLNVDCDLEPFRSVKPCGLTGDKITSLKELGVKISRNEMSEILKKHLEEIFFDRTT